MTVIKMKTADLIDAALDWAVAKCEGLLDPQDYYGKLIARVVIDPESFAPNGKPMLRINPCPQVYYDPQYAPSTNWADGGPIIERIKGFEFKQWLQSKPESCCEAHIHNYDGDWIQFGPTPLIAAMRCFVSSKLGDEVEVPAELCGDSDD